MTRISAYAGDDLARACGAPLDASGWDNDVGSGVGSMTNGDGMGAVTVLVDGADAGRSTCSLASGSRVGVRPRNLSIFARILLRMEELQ